MIDEPNFSDIDLNVIGRKIIKLSLIKNIFRI